MAVHLRDMTTLESRNPGVYAEFCKGNFTVNRSQRSFSRMSLDERPEHINTMSNRPDRDNNSSTKMDGSRSGDGTRCDIIPRLDRQARHGFIHSSPRG